MANCIFRLTVIFLVIFAVADGRTHQTRRYGTEQGTDANDFRKHQTDKEQIVDDDDANGRRNQEEYRRKEDKYRRDEDDGQLPVRRVYTRDIFSANQRATTRNKRHVRVQKPNTQNRDRREWPPLDQRNTNYDRRYQDEDRNNDQVERKQKQRRLRTQDRRDRNVQNRNGYMETNDRRDRGDQRNQNQDRRVRDRNDRRDWDRRYMTDWDVIDRYDLDRRSHDSNRREKDWVFRDRFDQNQYYDRHNNNDDRRARTYENRGVRYHDLRDQDDERLDQYSDYNNRVDDRNDYDRDDDDDDNDDRKNQDYDRTYWQQRQQNNRYNQNQYTRDTGNYNDDRRNQDYERTYQQQRQQNYRYNQNQYTRDTNNYNDRRNQDYERTYWQQRLQNYRHNPNQYTRDAGDYNDDRRNQDYERTDKQQRQQNYRNNQNQYTRDAGDYNDDRRNQDYERTDRQQRQQNYRNNQNQYTRDVGDYNDDRRNQDYERTDQQQRQQNYRNNQNQYTRDAGDNNDDRRNQDYERTYQHQRQQNYRNNQNQYTRDAGDYNDDRRNQDYERTDQQQRQQNYRNNQNQYTRDTGNYNDDRRNQDYERTYQQQRQQNYRNNQNQYTRDSDKDDELTRRYVDYTERLRFQGNQNNHWLQYSFQGDEFPKKNYNLQVHRLDIIQPDVKHQEVDPRILVWQEEPWYGNRIIPSESVRETENDDHYLEYLQIIDKSTAIVLKTVNNVSSESNHALEILNVLDNLSDQGICNPSEAHYDWIYSTAVPIAIAEVKMQPLRVAEKIKQKVDLSHLAIAEVRDLIETVATTLCQGETPDHCNIIIKNTINESPSKDVLGRQVVYLKHLASLARIFADYLPEYAVVAKSNNVLPYFSESKARTWPLVNKVITARLDAGAAIKKCRF